MFGLEGSGFVISISLTFLLIGLVVYLFKKQLFTLEKKFTTIFELSQSLATSVENLNNSNEKDKLKPVKDISKETVSTDEHVKLNSEPLCPFSTVKIIDIDQSTEHNILENMLELANTNMNTATIIDCSSNESETTSESENENDSDDNASDDNVSDDNVTEEDDKVSIEEEKSAETVTENATEVSTNIIKEISNDTTKQLEPLNLEESSRKDNLTQLKVTELKDLVIKNQIKTEKEVKSMKKLDLINLLKKNN